MVPIYERLIISATNTDVISSSSRLNSIPFAGVLIIRLQSDLGTAAANFAFTIQLPDGDVPVDSQQVPACNPALVGVIDERTMWMGSYKVRAGGHVVLAVVETGTAVLTAEFLLR